MSETDDLTWFSLFWTYFMRHAGACAETAIYKLPDKIFIIPLDLATLILSFSKAVHMAR